MGKRLFVEVKMVWKPNFLYLEGNVTEDGRFCL